MHVGHSNYWGARRACLNMPDGQMPLGWDAFMELQMAGISPAVVELQCWQDLGCPTGMPKHARQANDLAIEHLRAETDPWNLRWYESAVQLWSYSVHKNGGA